MVGVKGGFRRGLDLRPSFECRSLGQPGKPKRGTRRRLIRLAGVVEVKFKPASSQVQRMTVVIWNSSPVVLHRKRWLRSREGGVVSCSSTRDKGFRNVCHNQVEVKSWRLNGRGHGGLVMELCTIRPSSTPCEM